MMCHWHVINLLHCIHEVALCRAAHVGYVHKSIKQVTAAAATVAAAGYGRGGAVARLWNVHI
jgi:hypothetical protein